MVAPDLPLAITRPHGMDTPRSSAILRGVCTWLMFEGLCGSPVAALGRFRKPLLYPSELRGHKGLATQSTFLATTLATTRPLESHRLAHHDLIGEPRVPLRRLDRGMPEDLLKRGE